MMYTHAMVLAGLLAFLAFACALACGFFVQAWRLRRHYGSYLLFGFSSAAMACYCAALTTMYVWSAQGAPPEVVASALDVAVAGALMATALLLHFGMHHSGYAHTTRVASLCYLVAGVMVVALKGGMWRGDVVNGTAVQLGPFQLPYLHVQLSSTKTIILAAAPLCLGVAGGMFAREQRRDDGPALVTSFTTTLLVVTAFNDFVGLGAGRFATLPLLPFAFSLFGLSIGFAVVHRYGHVAASLEQRTVELHRLSGELGRSLQNLSTTRKTLQKNRQLAVVGSLIEQLASELSDPLERAAAALAAFGKNGHNNDSSLDQLETETIHINRLVSDLLSFARPIALDCDDIDLEAIIKHALSLADAYPDVDVGISCALPWPRIEADAEKLRQVFEHLIVNALHAVQQDGELTVDVSRVHYNGRPHVRVEVRDTGEGMAEADLRRALAPFFTTRPDGTGFGLPICKRVIESHGGELEVTSTLGVGTVVRVLLPTRARPSLSGRSPRHSTIPASEA